MKIYETYEILPHTHTSVYDCKFWLKASSSLSAKQILLNVNTINISFICKLISHVPSEFPKTPKIFPVSMICSHVCGSTLHTRIKQMVVRWYHAPTEKKKPERVIINHVCGRSDIKGTQQLQYTSYSYSESLFGFLSRHFRREKKKRILNRSIFRYEANSNVYRMKINIEWLGAGCWGFLLCIKIFPVFYFISIFSFRHSRFVA